MTDLKKALDLYKSNLLDAIRPASETEKRHLIANGAVLDENTSARILADLGWERWSCTLKELISKSGTVFKHLSKNLNDGAFAGNGIGFKAENTRISNSLDTFDQFIFFKGRLKVVLNCKMPYNGAAYCIHINGEARPSFTFRTFKQALEKVAELLNNN